MEIKEIKKFLEELELVYDADPEYQIGDTYFAETEKDVFDSLDKMVPGDATGAYLKHKEFDETHELTIELVDEDGYVLKVEEDTPENINDWEGKNVYDTDVINKEDAITTLNSLFQDYKVIDQNTKIEIAKKRPQIESLEGYKTIAKILQGKKGYNVAEEDEPMLTEDQPTLKSLLNNLAKYL